MPEVLELIPTVDNAQPKGTFASFPDSPFELFQPYLPEPVTPNSV